ncbi:MAG TPA: MFS transporter [Candidatus Limnocylindria bacterium]
MSEVLMAAYETSEGGERPTRKLPLGQLLNLSLYWLGINIIWGGINVVLQPRMDELVGTAASGTALALITAIGTVVAIAVQPTVGAISDYTISRWGRRKPYIAIGATLDLVFIAGVALSNTYLGVVAFVALLQFSSNFAQGPFQGYVPDLVPEEQVGTASALMGVMIMLGRVVGAGIGTIGLWTGSFVLATIGLGVIEVVTAIATLLTVNEGRHAPPREGRSLFRIAREAWGLDILEQRDFLWLLGSRLFVLMGPVVLTDFVYFYLNRAFALSDKETAVWIAVALPLFAVGTLLTIYPAAKLSDRFGRKPLIYASCAIGAVGMLGMALAPTVYVAVAIAPLVGVSAGAFVAVDWALMTELIPKVTSGRYMGISNVASAIAGPIAVTLAGITMDRVGALDFGAGPRAALLLALVFYALGALLLGPVREPGAKVALHAVPEAAA